MNQLVIPGLYLLAGFMAYAAVLHLTIGLSPSRDRVQMLFVGMCLVMAPYAVLYAQTLQAADVSEFIGALKWNVAAVLLFFLLFPWFVALYTGEKSPLPFLAGLSGLFAGLFVVNLTQPYSLQYDRLDGIRSLHLPWGEIVSSGVGHNGIWAYIAIAGIMVAFGYALYALGSVYRRQHRGADLAMMLAIGLFLLTAIQGILARFSVIDFIDLGPFGYLAVGLVMSVALTHETQQRLRTSEHRFRSLVEQSPFSIQMLSPEGRTERVNPAWERLWGVKPESLANYNILHDRQLVEKGIMPYIEKGFAGVATEIPPVIYNPADNPVVPGPTRDRWVRAYIYPIKDKVGTIDDVILMHEDVTERKLTEDALRESEEKLRGLYELSPLGIALTDMKGRYVELNKAFQDICGYPAEELKTLDYWTLTPRKYEAEEARQLELLAHTGHYGPYEKEYVRKDGSLVPLRLNGVLVTGRDGQKYIWSIVEDITESKRAEMALRRESEKNLALLHNASDGIHILDVEGNIIEVSDSFCAMLGYRRDEMIGMNVSQWDAQLTNTEVMQQLEEQFTRQERSQFETRHRRKDGSVFDVEVSGFPLELDGKPVLFNSSRDITGRKQSEASLRESEIRFRTIIEQSPIGISLSREGYTEDVNKVYLQMFGYDDISEVRGTPVINRIAPQCRPEVEDRIRRRIQGEQVEPHYETIGMRKDGSQFPLFVSAQRVMLRDGPLSCAYLIDITERKKAEEKIDHLAFYDQLTDLPNRRLLLDRLQQALASSARTGRQGALLLIDLNNFKALNDTLGHDIGDMLLREVGERLTSCVGEGDTVARFGGDEFVVMLGELSGDALEAAAQTEAVGEKSLATLSQPFLLGKHEFRNTSSIGATLFTGHQQEIEDLLKQADIAMYQAKKAGRNTLRFFDPEVQNTINARVALEGELHKALVNAQFRLHYQIQVDNSGRPLGAEALIRWAHPERGLVAPAQFIPLAEETGLVLPIGQWVLETACAQLKAWERDELTRELILSVNVSARQFIQVDFATQVQAAVQRHAINPNLLKLELTEGMLLENIEDTIATMNKLKEAGIKFSLDDFGTGYSSLQYLKHLPLDQLKIDQSFVRDVATDSNDKAIVRTIVAMAQSLNLDIIAEGVETEEQRQFLSNNGCTHYQGYLFCKPVPIEQFEELLKNG